MKLYSEYRFYKKNCNWFVGMSVIFMKQIVIRNHRSITVTLQRNLKSQKY